MTNAPSRLARAVTAVALCAAVALPAVANAVPASADDEPELECGVLPTTDVTLHHDLTCESGFHFVDGAVPVSIDLGGHTLTVTGPDASCDAPGACGAIAGATSVTNGVVIGALSDVGLITRVRVRGDVVLRAGFAGASVPATLRESVVEDAHVRIFGSDVTVELTVVVGGIEVIDSNNPVQRTNLTRNLVVNRNGPGITVHPEPGDFPDDVTGVIRHNVVVGSAGAGIDIGGGLWNIGDLAVDENIVLLNHGDGIRVATSTPGPPFVRGGPVHIADTLAVRNDGHGIDATWMEGFTDTGVVDGGHNRAMINELEPQCVGVDCL